MVILSLRVLPLGSDTETSSPRLWPMSALPTGDSLESLSGGAASAEPTIVNFRLAALLVLDVDGDADADDVVGELADVDDLRGAQALLELGDPLLEHRLLVLGVVVLGVLRDVAELARLLDPLGHLAALLGLQLLELRLELLEAFGGEDDVLRHGSLGWVRGAPGGRKTPHTAGNPGGGGAGRSRAV